MAIYSKEGEEYIQMKNTHLLTVAYKRRSLKFVLYFIYLADNRSNTASSGDYLFK